MVESILGIPLTTILGGLGGFAAGVSIITQILKNILPKSFPTKLLVMIISLILTMLSVFIFLTPNFKNISAGFLGSFVVSFIATYGWDSLKEIIDRYRYKRGE